jgi:CheY-like chemotaxis protein
MSSSDAGEQAVGLSILLVEDNLLVASALASVLQNAGYRVRCVVDGREAMEILSKTEAEVDVLICDLNLPGVSGRELLRLSVQTFPRRPVLVISGAVEEQMVDELFRLGAAGVVPKPVFPNDLLENVRRVAGRI